MKKEKYEKEIESLEKEVESLKTVNIGLTMPQNQNQRIKYLTKIKKESDQWKAKVIKLRNELNKRGIYVKI